MNTDIKKITIICILTILIFISLVFTKLNYKREEVPTFDSNEPEKIELPEIDPIVYDGLTLDELAEKLDRSLTNELSGMGYEIASRAINLGIDPYLAVAIILHETGCSWTCSTLLKNKNNVGGMKASSGNYASYPTLVDGIEAFMNNLYYNYYQKGLTTPEAMNKKYAESTAWSSKINNYIEKISAA